MLSTGEVSFFFGKAERMTVTNNDGRNNTVTTNDGIQLRLNSTYHIINLIIIA